MIFTCSMSDLFHEAVPDDFTVQMLQVSATAKHYIFQLLTKRVERLLDISPYLGRTPSDVWLGVSAEDQFWAEHRLPLFSHV